MYFAILLLLLLFKYLNVILGQHYSEDFGNVSLVRKVPVLKDGDFILTER